MQDIGSKRSARDILSFEGETASFRAIAISNRMAISFKPGYFPTLTEQREYWLKHKEAVEWVWSTLATGQRGVTQASILAPVARAYYSQDRDKLARFLELLREGFTTDEKEQAVILLRNYAISYGANVRGKKSSELYGKAERALVAFLRGETMRKLVGYSEEQFPLSEEQAGKQSTKSGRSKGNVIRLKKTA